MKTEERLRILAQAFYFTDYESCGEGLITYNLCNALAKLGCEIHVISPSYRLRQMPHPNVKMHQVPCSFQPYTSPKLSLRSFLYSIPIIKKNKIQLVHLMSQIALTPFSRFKLLPLVVSADIKWELAKDLDLNPNEVFELYSYRIPPKLFRKIDAFENLMTRDFLTKILKIKVYDRNIDLVICREKQLLADLSNVWPKNKLTHIPNGVDIYKFNPKVKPKFRRKDTVLFVGNLIMRKGVHYLLEAFRKVVREIPTARLMIIGKGPERDVRFFKELSKGIESNVKFLGFVSQLPPYYNSAEVFCSPSLGEPFGLVNLEAMACGLPVISTKAGGVPEIVINDYNGLLVPPADVDALAQAIIELLENKKKAKEMGENARKFVVNNFSWDVIAKSHASAYRTLI